MNTTAKPNFGHVESAPPDPILGITDAYKADPHPLKLNLGVGAYRTDEQQPYVLNVVKKTESILLENHLDKEYLPIEGYPKFLQAATKLVLGADCAPVRENRVCTIQSVGGTGALRLAAEFFKRFFPDMQVYLPNPTWGNHNHLLNYTGVKWVDYRYYNPSNHLLDINGMLEDIRNAPRGSAILLHACAHNPTGIDPTKEQWIQIAEVIEQCGHLAFWDFAYHGLPLEVWIKMLGLFECL